MKKWTRMTAAVLAAAVCAMAVPQAPAQAQEVPNGNGKVTQEERARLASYRSDFQQVKKIDRQIRSLTHRLRHDAREMRQLVHRAGDDRMKEQVKKDLGVFHDKLGQAHKLHRADLELNKQVHAARQNGDLEQLRQLAAQRLQNKRQQLTYLEEAHNALLTELTKVKKQVGVSGQSSTAR